jgi:hypothetical protein
VTSASAAARRLDPLALALSERFKVDRRRLPVLLTSAAVFATAWLAWLPSSALALSTGLWCGYCTACLGVALAGRACDWRLTDRWGLAALACIVLVAAGTGRGVETMLWTLHDLSTADQITRLAWHGVFVSALIAWPVAQAIALTRKLARLDAEREQVTASLLALQAQIEPHFLFNTLGVLRSLIRRDASGAVVLLDRMTDFLRAVLPGTRQTSTTLGREAEIVEAYLAIMASRLGDRLHYRVELDPASIGARVPPLLLQPLVENAIKHGIEPSDMGGEVQVRSRIEAGMLVLEVRNTGEAFGLQAGSTRPMDGRPRVGIANIDARLRALCGSAGSLAVGRAADGATLATVRLPFLVED